MAAKVPAASGASVPTNSFELMRQLRAAESEQNKNHALQQKENRFRKAEIQRETVENQLMRLEDYTDTPEGSRRARAFEDRLQMEEEDELSGQIEASHKQKQLEQFRDRVRLEVEKRQREEEDERQRKKALAEERRLAVLERLRKKKEEEEEIIRQAELRRQMIEEENQRILREIEERMQAEQRNMIMEDALSSYAEAEYKDELERKALREKEAKRIAEWEAEQAKKDEAASEARKARSAELEIKKKKLAELKRSRQETKSSESDSNDSKVSAAVAAREEQLKLSKQLKIQNKAKFVSKRIKDNTGSADLSEMLKSGSSKGGSQQSSLLPSLAPVSESGDKNAPSPEAILPPEVVSSIKAISSESELREMQKQVMVEKRKLRLEQRQTSSDNVGQPNSNSDQPDVTKKVDELSAKEALILIQIESVLQKGKEEGKGDNQLGESAVKEPELIPRIVSSNNLLKKTDSAASVLSHSSKYGAGGIGMTQHGDVFEQAESLLQAMKHTLASEGHGQVHHGDSRMSMGNQPQSIILLELKISELMKRMPQQSSMDPLGYTDKLHKALQELEKIRHQKLQNAKNNASLPVNKSEQKDVKLHNLNKSQVDSAPQNGQKMVESSSAREIKLKAIPEAMRHSSTPLLYTLSSSMSIEEDRTLTRNIADKPVVGSTVQIEESEERNISKRSRTQHSVVVEVETIEESMRPSLNQANKSTGSRLDREIVVESAHENHRRIEKSAAAAQKKNVAVAIEIEEDVDLFNEDDDIPEDPYANIPGWTESLNTTMATSAHHAAFYGYTDVLELLSKYFDVFVMDDKGRTPLFYAALRNQLGAVTLLVSIEPQWIEVGDVNGDTPMHAASISDSALVLEFLLSCEVNPDIANNMGLTCAHIANSSTVLDLLYRWGGTLYCVDYENRMPLFLACKDGRPDCVNYLCRATPFEYLLWADAEGNNCMHMAAINGHYHCLEEMCRWVTGVESFYITNLKGYTAAHVASNQKVLQTLYENGADLWTKDPKGRYPLFIASFHGRFDCVLFLLDLALQRKENLIGNLDRAGDSALHAACLCGHIRCVILLLFFLRDMPNGAGLSPSQLAQRAGHTLVAELVSYVEQQRVAGYSTLDIFNCTIAKYLPVAQYYGSRWTKLYDSSCDTLYYFDRVSGLSQWERPLHFDENPKDEKARDVARGVLIQFYQKYNPEKLKDMNEILYAFRDNYSELFIQLANRYSVEDLWMFEGIYFD